MLDKCSETTFDGKHICQLPEGHDGPHLDDRGTNIAVGWPQLEDVDIERKWTWQRDVPAE